MFSDGEQFLPPPPAVSNVNTTRSLVVARRGTAAITVLCLCSEFMKVQPFQLACDHGNQRNCSERNDTGTDFTVSELPELYTPFHRQRNRQIYLKRNSDSASDYLVWENKQYF